MQSNSSLIALAGAATLATGTATMNREMTDAEVSRALSTPRRRKRKGAAKVQTPEELYAPLIKLGKVKVIRRRGAPPIIKWL